MDDPSIVLTLQDEADDDDDLDLDCVQVIDQAILTLTSEQSNNLCLVCGKFVTTSLDDEGKNIFDGNNVTNLSDHKLCDILGKVLDLEIQSGKVHSELICGGCFKLIEEWEMFSVRSNAIKDQLNKQYQITLTCVSNNDGPYRPFVEISDDINNRKCSNKLELQFTTKEKTIKEKIIKEKTTEEMTKENNLFPEDDSCSSDPEFEPAGHPHGSRKTKGRNRGGDRDTQRCYSKCDGRTLPGRPRKVHPGDRSNKATTMNFGPNNSNRLCRWCGLLTPSSNHLKEHVKIHQCSKCGLTLSHVSHLRQHYKLVHGIVTEDSNDKKTFLCHICDKSYASAGSLHNHKVTSHSTMLVICKVCGAEFKHSKYLKTHLKRHKEKTQKCVSCDASFYLKGDLNKHINHVHNKCRP